MKTFRALVIMLFGMALTIVHAAPRGQTWTASELHLAINKLNVLGTVLYIGAHPDDENTAVLAYLVKDRLVRAAYLSLTRGDGGQNLIGSEKGERMGLIRTQELLAARKIDGAEQFFTRAIDFGYSKSADESMAIWGRDQVLSDIVWVIRSFQPDILITRFPIDGGGHGHHMASAILAVEAFDAAADPARFVEQLAYVKPWRARRIFWNAWRPGGMSDAEAAKFVSVDVGGYNPLLGRSYTELAGESRSMHKSQGFGSAERRGSRSEYFQLLAGEPAAQDILQGVDMSWSRIPGGTALTGLFQRAAEEFRAENPSRALPALLQAWQALKKLPPDVRVQHKQKELQDVIRQCAGLWLEAISDTYTTCSGESVNVALNIVSRSRIPVVLQDVQWPFSQTMNGSEEKLSYNQPLERKSRILIPREMPVTQPYWLEQPPGKGLYQVADRQLIGQPVAPDPITLACRLRIQDQVVNFSLPVRYRWTDPVEGDLYRPLEIMPAAAVNPQNGLVVFPDQQGKPVTFTLVAGRDQVTGVVHLRLPGGWQAQPGEIPFSLSAKNDELKVQFTVFPPAQQSTATLTAQVLVNGSVSGRGMATITYPHIPIITLFPQAEMQLLRLEIRTRNENIGYIAGSGDEIPEYLRQLGYAVTLLDDQALENEPLEQYQAIITGVRAYNTRQRLRFVQPRLLGYVQSGGVLVVQYNTNSRLVTDQIGPYPFRISRDRVTVEEAPIEFTLAGHPLLNQPNHITPADFQGWVQERGLYFADQLDARYETMLACNDPSESAKSGGMIYAPYGKGVFIYSAYAWFRQLPAGVPGAYRIFANMIAGGRP